MNTWQALRQLKALLLAAEWPDGDQEKVLGSCLVTVAMEEQAFAQLRPPTALIVPTDAQHDPEDPGLVMQQVELVLVVPMRSSPWGEDLLLGGPRTNGQGSSSGRGLLEVEEAVLSAVRELDQTDGIRLRLQQAGSAAAARDQGWGDVMTRSYRLELWTGMDRSYPPPSRLAGSDGGSGVANLTWTLPPSRFDRLNVVLRRASGSTAPASVTDGTGVTLGSALATSVADNPGVGTWSYALFAGYDEANATPATADRYSEAVTATVVLA